MRIKGKCYCDVCMKELDNYYDTCFVIADDNGEMQKRHYCKEHQVFYNLFSDLRTGKIISRTTVIKEEPKKEFDSLELYDIITDIMKKYLGYTLESIPMDRDLVECMKKNLDSEISFDRLKVKGVIKE